MADDDLDYSDTNVGSAQAQTVRKNISLKLKGKGRPSRVKRTSKGRRSNSTKKSIIGVNNEEPPIADNPTPETTPIEKPISELINLDDVISKLEAPSFSPMDRAFPEPLHQNKKLHWDHKVNLIGEKVVNPMIHCCEKCTLPILNYGRMIPCKHVFCYDCARKADMCPKCDVKVQKVEPTSLGTVFMCIFGGSRYGPVACGRTYLSQRDLQAHVNHRHLKTTSSGSNNVSGQCNPSHSATAASLSAAAHIPMTRDPRDPRGHVLSDVSHPSQGVIVSHAQHSHGSDHRDQGDHSLSSAIPTGNTASQQRQYPHSPASYSSTVPVSSARPNLITVPIQDDSTGGLSQHVHSQQSHSSQYPPAGTTNHSLPSHQHPASSYPPPPHAYQHAIPAAASAYSQAPPMTTQTFTPHQPPPVHHPPPMHGPTGPSTLYSTPPPVHHPPPVTYSAQQTAGNPHTSRTLLSQRFPTSSSYDEPYQLQAWNATNVPPPNRGALPPRPIPAPSANHPHIPPRGSSDSSYRPPYYQ